MSWEFENGARDGTGRGKRRTSTTTTTTTTTTERDRIEQPRKSRRCPRPTIAASSISSTSSSRGGSNSTPLELARPLPGGFAAAFFVLGVQVRGLQTAVEALETVLFFLLEELVAQGCGAHVGRGKVGGGGHGGGLGVLEEGDGELAGAGIGRGGTKVEAGVGAQLMGAGVA